MVNFEILNFLDISLLNPELIVLTKYTLNAYWTDSMISHDMSMSS